jgi:hypothetical protein
MLREAAMRAALGAVSILAACSLLGALARAQTLGAGFDSGRATPSDVAHLAQDIAKVMNAESVLARGAGENFNIQDIVKALNEERQSETIGATADSEIPDFGPVGAATAVRRWWISHVLQPALDIAANPAASCSLARSMLERIWSMERQAQVIGLRDEAFGTLGDGDSIMTRAFTIARDRCLQEAFDECMLTGSGQELTEAVSSWERQTGIIGVALPADWDDHATYLLRRCTVYKVIYDMDLHAGDESSVIHGSYNLFLQLGEGSNAVARIGGGRWTTRVQDTAAPDIEIRRLDCGPRAKMCEQSTPFHGGAACGIVHVKREGKDQIATWVHNHDATDNLMGGHVEIRTVPHTGGQNTLILQFLPPIFFVNEEQPEDDMPLPSSNGTPIFLEAAQVADVPPAEGDPCPLAPVLVNDDTWVRGAYPVLFKTAHTANHNGAQETTHFDVVHRPDLFPAEEIRPEWEFPQPPEPPARIPAR